MSIPVFARFETELRVRPDDIDLYQHVHSTRYLDYVLAARFDQMERCYGMSMKAASIQYRRPLGIGDRMIVRTGITEFHPDGVRVGFEIDRADNRKRVCDGACDYTLVTLADGRATMIPEDIRAKYGI